MSVRTIERDILALQEAGVPISAQHGRRGGYVLDRSMTLPPLNFTPAEAVAMAVGLRRLDDTPWARDARTALLKVVAAMPEGALPAPARWPTACACSCSRSSRRTRRSPTPWCAPSRTPRRSSSTTSTSASRPTLREVEPHHVVLGPNGSYVTGWCRLRQDERVFRIDRIRSVAALPGEFEQPVREVGVDDYETRTPAWE